ncbi:MAG TPA: lysophospholipid acyltransferase family protein [Blastocatellia bacterium]|nr:lysophospholipid acyltransferase family protein [Blastocatellia bacterium]
MSRSQRSPLRNWLEFVPVWLLLKTLTCAPRAVAIATGQIVGRTAYYLHARLRRTGEGNLLMAMPELTAKARKRILLGVFRNLGRLVGEFSQLPKLTRESIADIVVYEGFENYARAARKGRGVLLLTGHIGAWELCAFAHGMYGHRLSFLTRPLDNPLMERLIGQYRELSGNRIIDKNKAVKPVLEILKRGGDVGLLIDSNTLSDQGVFCDFFGIPACSTIGLAVFALRTEAPVVPGFLVWDERLQKHRLCFEPEVALVRTGDFKDEVRVNTALFTKVIEEQVRKYPDQWLWVHKRWHTRPEGEPELYDSPEPNPPKLLPANSKRNAVSPL